MYFSFESRGDPMEKLEYTVSEENRLTLCDEISQAVVSFCGNYITDRRELQRYRLTVEECLLNWLEKDAVGKKVTFSCGKKILRPPCFEISFSGPALNPYRTDQTLGAFGDSTLRTLGLFPTYQYRLETNILRFTLRNDGKTSLKSLVLVLAASVVVGMLGSLLLPEDIVTFLQNDIISPVYNTFFDLLNCIAGPMIFLSVAWGVYGIGDASTLSRVGKKMLRIYLGNVFLVAGLAMLLFPLFGLSLSWTNTGISTASGLFGMILGFFPNNVFSPFLTGNTMQIIFIAFAVGVALLFLGKQTEAVARAIEQINDLLQFFMNLISKLVPYFVFLVIVSLFWSGSFGVLTSSWMMLVILLASIALTCLGFYIFTGARHGVRVKTLMKKCFPSFLVALTTASSAATFSTNMETAEKKLGIHQSISCFGIPLGMVIHTPIAVLNNMAMAFFFAQYYHIECSLMWLVTAAVLCGILAVATPPIPGGGTAAYTMLFLQLGIPAEALAIALALDMITDFFITSGEMFCLLPTLVNISGRIGMLDEDILRKDD